MKSLLIALVFLSSLSVGTTVAHAVVPGEYELSGSRSTSGYELSGSRNTGGTGQSVTLMNPLKSGAKLEDFLESILKFVIRIGSIAVILMLVFVGYKFVVAQGSDTKLTEAKNMLLWTLIGSLILLGAQAISLAIQATVKSLGG